MQSKIAHAAERKAFGMVLDQIIKSASGDDREKNIGHLVDMAGKLLKDTSPGATRGIKKGSTLGPSGRSTCSGSSTRPIRTCSRPPY